MIEATKAEQALYLAAFISDSVLSSVAHPGRCPIATPWLMEALKLAGSVLNGYHRPASMAEQDHAARLYSRIEQALRTS